MAFVEGLILNEMVKNETFGSWMNHKNSISIQWLPYFTYWVRTLTALLRGDKSRKMWGLVVPSQCPFSLSSPALLQTSVSEPPAGFPEQLSSTTPLYHAVSCHSPAGMKPSHLDWSLSLWAKINHSLLKFVLRVLFHRGVVLIHSNWCKQRKITIQLNNVTFFLF